MQIGPARSGLSLAIDEMVLATTLHARLHTLGRAIELIREM